MDDMRRFELAAAAWAAGGVAPGAAASSARALAADSGVQVVVLVEGESDAAALEHLALRRGRNLSAEGVAIVPLGGATSIGRFMTAFVQEDLGIRLAGLCDEGEEGFFRRALERAGLGSDLTRADMNRLGFHMCVADLEDELIRANGSASVEEVIEAQGELRSFRTFQRQPAQRERPIEHQLRRFLGTHSGRKLQYAEALVRSLDLDNVPEPLDRLLSGV